MESLRIVVGAETYPPDVNGAAQAAARLAAGLAGRGHEVHVVAPSPTGRATREVRDGVTVHGVRSRRYVGHASHRVSLPWEVSAHVRRLVAELRPDVVHSHGHVLVGRAVVAAARTHGVPVVMTNHLVPENLVAYLPVPRPLHGAFAAAMWRDQGRVFARADVVTTPTPRAAELLMDRTGLTGVLPVSNGIDAQRFAARGRRRPGAVPTVLFVGRLDEEKRVDELIRAFALLPTEVPARLEIVGDGCRRERWSALADELGIAADVRFRGHVTDAELLEAYASADVFCMPSVAELQSLATLEAMSAGLPVVAADAMALPHLVRPGENGALYPPGDVAALAGHLLALLDDPALRERAGAASVRLAERHAFGRTLEEFEDIYARVTARVPVPA
ncbi:glycosyltransferase [Puerhibacterium puerhi]|uniref:glycosyltransferase n=1 Tax=Puerhibacterium puerhi TaxID=2692623 RepID=UPI001356FF0E|nr:glycosyltransferase [Puerhibacterium puerhi]